MAEQKSSLINDPSRQVALGSIAASICSGRSERSIRQRVLVYACGLLLAVSHSCLAADRFAIEPIERWSNVFAESETRWKYRFAGEGRPNRGHWRLTINHRTAATGEFELNGDANQPVERIVTLTWPKVKTHTVLPVLLTVSAGEVTHERIVTVFPRDAFADRSEWLKKRKIRLFDPEGETATRLKDAGIPFEQIQMSELANVSEGILIVTEGISLGKDGDSVDRLRQALDRGVSVLCLAPKDGQISFPGNNQGLQSVQLRQADVIRELDKHFDDVIWANGPSQQSGLQFISSTEQVVADVTRDVKSWPWCEWTYVSKSDQRLRFIFCGFGIIRSWDDGPTARYLFLRLLERLAESTDSITKVADKP